MTNETGSHTPQIALSSGERDRVVLPSKVPTVHRPRLSSEYAPGRPETDLWADTAMHILFPPPPPFLPFTMKVHPNAISDDRAR